MSNKHAKNILNYNLYEISVKITLNYKSNGCNWSASLFFNIVCILHYYHWQKYGCWSMIKYLKISKCDSEVVEISNWVIMRECEFCYSLQNLLLKIITLKIIQTCLPELKRKLLKNQEKINKCSPLNKFLADGENVSSF